MVPLDPNGPYVANEAGAEFEDPKVRRRFVGRVFGLVGLQLAFTAALIAACLFAEDLGESVEQNDVLALIAFLLYCVALFSIVLSRRVRRGPLGVVCLLVLTASMAYSAAHSSTEYSNWTALLAACLTVIIVLAICLASVCTHLDLTKYRAFVGYFIVFVLVYSGILLVLRILLPDSHWLELLAGGAWALLFSVLLLYEVQTIVGGHAISVRPDELIFATSIIYVQMILVYQMLLMCNFV